MKLQDYRKHLSELNKKTDVGIFTDDREIILYGAGSLGVLSMEVLNALGRKPLFAVDKSKTGDLLGIPIRPIGELTEEEKDNCLFLICISTVSYNEVTAFLSDNGIKHRMQFYTYAYFISPNILGNGWVLKDEEYKSSLAEEVYELISHDDTSVAHYLSFLYWKRFNREVIFDGYPVASGKKYFKCDIMPRLTDHEVFLDLGCYEGAIIGKFIEAVNNTYFSAVGVEPVKRFADAARSQYKDKRISISECAISDHDGTEFLNDKIGMGCHLDPFDGKEVAVKTIDSLSIDPTIVKIHTEGEELKCLKGGIKTFKRNRPLIFVMADHNSDGWYRLPLFVKELKDYRLYFRIHDYCGNSAVWYFIPVERLVR